MTAIKRIVATMLAFVSLLFSSLAGITDSEESRFRVTTYVVASNVQQQERLHSEDFDIITDAILFGCANFNAEGEVVLQEDVLETALSNLRAVIGERDVKIHLNLLGPHSVEGHEDYTDDMNDQGHQHTLAFRSGVLEDNIVAVLEKYDFDGVYFDYEYPLNYGNWTPFNQFLVRLDSKLGDRLLGLAVTEWDIKLSLGSFMAVDRFEVMLYDIFDDLGRHSTPEKAIELSKKLNLYSIPREKLDFGLPFYARPTDKGAYWYDYASFCADIDENGYYYDSSIDKTFWFNRPDDIAEKTDYALEKGFGGVMIWHYSCDLPSSDSRSLLAAIDRTVNR